MPIIVYLRMKPNFIFTFVSIHSHALRKFAPGMSLLTRSLSVLRSLSPRYSVFYGYERLSSSSGGADQPRSGDWVVLLSEVNFKRKFDDFRRAFQELRENIHPMGLRFTPDWVLFDKQFEKFMSDYKQFKDNSLLKCGSQPMVLSSDIDEPPPPEDLARKKFGKQLGCFRNGLEKFSERTSKILSIHPTIMSTIFSMTKGYSTSIDNGITSDMKIVKGLTNVLKDLYRKLGKPIPKQPQEDLWCHREWHSTTQTVISVLAFVHWMETKSLILPRTVEEKLGFESPEFDLELEDYFFGLLMMSNELIEYTNTLYISGNHDTLRNVGAFMINMEETLGVLFLSNDNLHEGFEAKTMSNDNLHEGFEDLKHNVQTVKDMISAASWLLEE